MHYASGRDSERAEKKDGEEERKRIERERERERERGILNARKILVYDIGLRYVARGALSRCSPLMHFMSPIIN
jgi:hypothetical protein